MIPTATLESCGEQYRIIDLSAFAGEALYGLPWLHRIVLENLLRNDDGQGESLAMISQWLATGRSDAEIAFFPGRILMHDTTCGPALVDIAAARATLAEAGGDPAALQPVLRIDVSTDHSVAVDHFAVRDALARNMATEIERNAERYRFMKWAALALGDVTVHPPGTGIMHTINLERLARVVTTQTRDGAVWVMPDTLIGTDSHTPMINGIGVLGWGVGGLEAESVMLGMPVTMRLPEIVGVRLAGVKRDGVLATDLALAVTERLRRAPLAGRFVEFFGPGVAGLSAGERSVIANMAPEYGAATGYFPIDRRTLDYLSATGRDARQIELVEDYARRQGLWFDPQACPAYADVIDIDLGAVKTSLAGPRRPQDRLSPDATRSALETLRGAKLLPRQRNEVPDGAVAIAAITSCTNTSDPRLVIAAGLLARKARALGLKPQPWVKTSLAPGSPTAERYLGRAGLLDDLEALGFGIVGYGCTTCIGNSGALPEMVMDAMRTRAITPVALLSGNRNFPGRVHAQIEAAFLASPPLVVAYALAGDVDRDILSEPLGSSKDGKPVFLSDLWPSGDEIDAALTQAVRQSDYAAAYETAEDSQVWRELDAPGGELYPWDPASTYLRRPPFASLDQPARLGRYIAHPLIVVGDDITTDHISPAGAIASDSEAGKYLVAQGEDPRDLNVFAARRGNWEVMLRGVFTNRNVRNLLGAAIPPGATIHYPSGAVLPLWRAASRYAQDGDSVVIVAGERYGMGSSRDWAAKGAALLGARAVLAASFERIHRSNLINMGVLPLRLPPGLDPAALKLASGDRVEIDAPQIAPRMDIRITLHRVSGGRENFLARAEVETRLEAEILAAGGLLPMVLRQRLSQGASA